MGSSISALLLAQLLLGPASAAIVDLSALESDTAAESVTRRVLFKLDATRPQLAHDDEGRRAQRAVAVGASLGCAGTKRLFRHAGKHEVDQLAAGLHLWFAAQCDTEALAVAAMKSFAGTASEAADDVAYMEPELKPSASIQSNDPELTNQPHYGAMNLFQAWNLERGSPSVVVQVLDTGIDLEHEDFQNNIWRNELEICGNGIDDDDNGYVDDCHGYNHADDTGGDLQGDGWHGSHTAGTIAADTDNGVGVAGVAGGTSDSPGVKLMISVGFGTTSTGGFAEALIYGANNGARISSNSWGYTLPGPLPQTEKAAIDYYNSKNGIVVFAAGNDGSDDEYNPGAYEGVVGVAAVDNSGVAASFTNYGAWIDIAAPGVSVLSTTTKDEYGYASGTSMACPHVAGVFALGWSADPAASKEKLLGCAYSTARDVDSLNAAKYQGGALGAGFMDAEAFVACVILLAPSAAPTASPAPTTTRPTLQPSISPAPTEGCGPCDQELKLTLTTDNYPAETSWKLSHVSAGSPCTIDDVTGGDYTEPAMDYSYTFSATVCAGEDYTFTVEDTYSDGMCCAYGEGGYELKLEGVLVASGGEFGGQDSTTFTSESDGERAADEPRSVFVDETEDADEDLFGDPDADLDVQDDSDDEPAEPGAVDDDDDDIAGDAKMVLTKPLHFTVPYGTLRGTLRRALRPYVG
ncbi:peptidase S8/S53 domain-containing protein [Pelagophyceae sp. CCMP2097]|nr:peptidase S8/S53 domain-containing protein [Pelagophyceae sp. CCMP2097]